MRIYLEHPLKARLGLQTVSLCSRTLTVDHGSAHFSKTIQGILLLLLLACLLGPLYKVKAADSLSPVAKAHSIVKDRLSQPGMALCEVIPFELTHDEILVKARINGGEPLDFLLDTGATETIIDRHVATENLLDKAGSVTITAALNAITVHTSALNTLAVGNLIAKNVQALILDLAPQKHQLDVNLAGVIGADILGRYAVTIDYDKKELTVQDSGRLRAGTDKTGIPLVLTPGAVVKAKLADQEVSFLCDTGANLNQLPPKVGRALSQGHRKLQLEGAGLGKLSTTLEEVVVDKVTLGNQTVRRVRFAYPLKESTVEGAGFFETTGWGVLGNPFWENFRVTIDYPSHQLFLEPGTRLKSGRQLELLIGSGDNRLVLHHQFRLAEESYQQALAQARANKDSLNLSRILGRLGNLHRIMAKDLERPDQAAVAYKYFAQAEAILKTAPDERVEGRLLADWSLLYLDGGQGADAYRTIDVAQRLAPHDPEVLVDTCVHLFRAREYKRMQETLNQVLALEPNNWTALWYQVKLQEIYQTQAELKKTLGEILKYYPWSRLARQKLDQLSGLAGPMP